MLSVYIKKGFNDNVFNKIKAVLLEVFSQKILLESLGIFRKQCIKVTKCNIQVSGNMCIECHMVPTSVWNVCDPHIHWVKLVFSPFTLKSRVNYPFIKNLSEELKSPYL